ncbi:hypothetical protein G6F57_011256 [Rhizopus arrhizus]|nr:hypothetical protein G6F33_004675 [Rhizopus arrhizus]KAG0931068.1 hypothetical protein G6F30_011355 [Rhizopus arrhizus]KAG0956259.1 hypothetical protein G6F32_002176 [Rhizopus arrhizus]KAG0983207.1 hypothetical protein G6F28_011007 [Rhizopus arrhizus]KAG0988977.1 hypothetical protein G6F29_001328 [Rhizopus arrhizus]
MVPSARSEIIDIEQDQTSQTEITTGPNMNNLQNSFRIPLFEKGQDPKEWLDMYEAGTKLSKTKEEEKLTLVPGFFASSSARRGFFNQEFANWGDFREEFLDRFAIRRGSPKKILKKILEIKRLPDEPIRMYIDRFDELKTAHVRETKKNSTSTCLTKEDLKEAFINGIRPKRLKETIKQAAPATLQDAKRLAKSKDDDDSSDEEESYSDESDSDQYEYRKQTTSKTSDKKNATKPTLRKEKTVIKVPAKNNEEASVQESMQKLAESFQSLSLLVQNQISRNNSSQQNYAKERSCYNCQGMGHDAKSCTKTCKLCHGKQGDHVYWDCPQYRPKSGSGANGSYLVLHSATSDEEVSDDNCEPAYAVPKRSHESSANERKTRSGKKLRVHDTIPSNHPKAKKISIQGERPVTKEITNAPMEIDRTQPKKKIQAMVYQPKVKEVLPTTGFEEPTFALQEGVLPGNTIKPEDVFNAKLFRCSINQFNNSIRGFRTGVRKASVKKQANPRKKIVQKEQVLHTKDRAIVKKSIPHVEIILNGTVMTDAVLDGGSVSTLISYDLLRAAGPVNLEPTTKTQGMADGSEAKPLGIVRGLTISVQDVVITTDAVVYDHQAYSLLIGSLDMHRLGIVTDWGSYHWCINSNRGIEPLNVEYDPLQYRIIPLEKQDYVEDDSSSEYDQEYSDEEESEGLDVSYLVMPCVDSVAETEASYLQTETGKLQATKPEPPSTTLDLQSEVDKAVAKCNLNDDNKERLRSLLYQYLDCFGVDYKDLKQTNLLELHIDTGDHRPILKRPNRYMSHAELDMLKQEIETMLSNGQVMPTTHTPNQKGVTNGGWAFPALYVKKKNGERRLCVQFQELNAATVKDAWPLPSIADLLESYQGAKVFSTMDLLKGFNQIRVAEDSVQKLTMATPWGCYSFKVMPFGIVNGPATFSRAIYLAMQGYLNEFVSTYIDDITVYSHELEEHFEHLSLVMQRLREVNMVLKPSKCDFAKQEVEVLGFVVSEFGIKPHPANVKKVLDFPKPKNKTDVRAFASLSGFYRRHVQAFGDLMDPLNKLLKKNVEFHWNEEHEKSFRAIKQCIIEAAVLKYPDPKKPYKIYTDASDIGLGAVLVQYDEQIQEDRPVCFLSRKMMPAEINYPTVEKEILAVIYAFKKLRKYLLDKQFELFTDNTAVRYLFCKMDPSQRLQRWILAVQEYTFKVHHLPGKQNVVADVLSRYPPSKLNESDLEDLPDTMYPSWLVQDLEDSYEDYLNEIVQFLKNPVEFTKENEKLRLRASKFKLNEEGQLYKRLKPERYIKIPKITEREAVLREVHDGHGHFGQEATWARMYSGYWWPGAYQDVKDYVASCTKCQVYARASTKTPLVGTVPITSLFERFAIDYVGPFPASKKGNKYIIVAMEYFTRWPIARAVKSTDSKTTIDFLCRSFRRVRQR